MTKNIFLMSILILNGNEFENMHNFDVCMAPLMIKLQALWKGVATYDMANVIG
jgi:hypothetical protein